MRALTRCSSTPRSWFVVSALGVGYFLSSARSVRAQALGRIEQSHRAPAPSTDSPASSSSSTSSSSSRSAYRTTSDRGSDSSLGCIILGPWTGYCLYGATWLRADRSESAETLAVRSAYAGTYEGLPRPLPPAPRYAELSGSAFLGVTEKVRGHELSARSWLWVGGLNASWLRLYEPTSPTLRELDLLRFSTVATLVAARRVEAHMLLGVDLLRGQQWSPAFGPGLEVRTYPTQNTTVSGSFQASIFGHGYPLIDSRLEFGVALGRVDIRAGGRWFYQPIHREPSVSIFGPSLSILVRLGP